MGGKHPPGYMHKYWLKNKETILAKRKENYAANKEEINKRRSELHQINKEKENQRCREYYSIHKTEHKERCKIYNKEHEEEIKQQRKIHYISGGWTNNAVRKKAARLNLIAILGGKCCRCGFDDPRALQIDHINGNGWKEYKTIGAYAIYKKILEGKTEEYQLLCANCNWIKRYEKCELGKNKNNRAWVESQKRKQP